MNSERPTPEDYAPYNTFPAFTKGYNAYLKCNPVCPFDPDSVDAQAWDRGAEYAMRLARFNRIGE